MGERKNGANPCMSMIELKDDGISISMHRCVACRNESRCVVCNKRKFNGHTGKVKVNNRNQDSSEIDQRRKEKMPARLRQGGQAERGYAAVIWRLALPS